VNPSSSKRLNKEALMKAASFRYFDPKTPDEVVALLGQWGDEAKLLAGGQTQGPMMNFRLLSPAVLIDLNGVVSLSYLRKSAEGLSIGAMTRQQMLEDDETLAANQPLIAATMPLIAHRAIRTRGTVGGSLSHADPAAEWGGLALALDAKMVIRHGSNGQRTVAAAEFFRGLLETTIQADELLTEIRVPAWPPDAGWSIQEFSRRHGDFALTGIVCIVTVDQDGRCIQIRLVAFGVEPCPIRLTVAEDKMLGRQLNERTIREAGRAAAAKVEPLNDRQASSEYRRRLVEVLLESAVTEALSRCRTTKV
jgi:carbon-monoxide dehydrogenase medium subunit